MERAAKDIRNHRTEADERVADGGKKCHKVMECINAGMTAADFDLSDYQQWGIFYAYQETSQAIELFERENELSKMERQMIAEERIWAVDPLSGEKLWSGMADLRVTWKSRPDLGMIFEYKFGYVEHPAADRNIQNISNAVLWALETGVQNMKAYLIQPLCGEADFRTTHVYYDKDFIDQSYQQLLGILHEAENVDPADIESGEAMNPGVRQCKYCAALNVCKKARITKALIEQIESALSANRMAEALELKGLAEISIEKTKQTAKELLMADPDAIPGFKLTKRSETWWFSGDGIAEAENALEGIVSPDDFANLCKLTPPGKGVLVDYISENYRTEEGKKLSIKKIGELLSGLIAELPENKRHLTLREGHVAPTNKGK